jgi:hypothetical protein
MSNPLKKVEAAPIDQVAQSEATAIMSMIERAARDPAIDIEKLERLFKLQQDAADRRAKTEYLAAFSELQADLPTATRRGTGHNNKKYARFEDVVEALREPLAKHGFSLSHRIDTANNIIRVTGVLGHKAGHSEQTEITLPPDTSGNKPMTHAIASSISYGKRYVSLTLTGIATDDDDDAKAAVAGPTITEDQQIELRDIIEAKSLNEAQFCEYMKVEKLSALPVSKFDTAKAVLIKAKAR